MKPMNTESSPGSIPGLKVPEVNAEAHRQQLKITLFNAHKSAALTVWLVAVPCFFLFAVAMKHHFHYNLGVFAIIEEFVASIDQTCGFPLSVLLLVGLPLSAIAINLLSILHVRLEPAQREMVVTIKLRWKNIALLLLCLFLVGTFLLYGLVDNIHHSLPGSGL
jgi:hypothetical protein